MTDIYGGIWLENLVKEDRHFELQMELFEEGVIQGVQLARVAHPSFTPDLTVASLPQTFSRLPDDLKLFFHFGAEDVGVDLGENLDEYGIFAEKAQKLGINWADWNQQTIEWGLQVAQAASGRIDKNFPLGVVHPGYGKDINDVVARKNVVSTLKALDNGTGIAVENVMAIVDKKFPGAEGTLEAWSRDQYWGFGGTPNDMNRLLSELGSRWRCLIDFSHIMVTVNQAIALREPLLYKCCSLEQTVQANLDLLHWPICHFSGTPDTLVDNHGYFTATPPPPVRDALQQMDAVCLEIMFQPDTAQQEIENFREQYLN